MLDSQSTKLKLIESIENTQKLNFKIEEKIFIKTNFVGHSMVEIVGNSKDQFFVELIDSGVVIHSSKINCNMWTKAFRSYFTDWQIRITNLSKNCIIYDEKINLKEKTVYISFESKSLGDTLAWFPYVEEFRKKHECNLVVSTFLNHLFIDQYSEIKFVQPGQKVDNIYAYYRLGWFYENNQFNRNLHPRDFKSEPLQKTASDILGIDYVEMIPKLKLNKVEKKKKVGIGFHSTAQSKYWNNPLGWQEVVDYLKDLGYDCVVYSREGNGYMDNYYPNGIRQFSGNIDSIINDIQSCHFFIGLGSGLSWLAWCCEIPVVLISGFSKRFTEPTINTYRVINETVCNGCFNVERLDAGDWNWCPRHKNTERQFECTKQITSTSVIKQINSIISGENSDVTGD